MTTNFCQLCEQQATSIMELRVEFTNGRQRISTTVGYGCRSCANRLGALAKPRRETIGKALIAALKAAAADADRQSTLL